MSISVKPSIFMEPQAIRDLLVALYGWDPAFQSQNSKSEAFGQLNTGAEDGEAFRKARLVRPREPILWTTWTSERRMQGDDGGSSSPSSERGTLSAFLATNIQAVQLIRRPCDLIK
ncbi:hypothetical protein EV421DRAFT_2035094 [Armillaria borealis]|uniref:Uncharacterized protein n=1 Tax=Armillaria borealis TaxID=47425 RepID=A0AA39JLD9_9AGAR|nr:hypothetical protein EV421DRAFT_2035091 [Armillaria borealis]KAK0444075.1 hypothetical protein EV421DRAFT_2035094 [Armillaria borealis]